MSKLKTRTLLNFCFGLDEFMAGICTCLVGRDIIGKELAKNKCPQASFFKDSRLMSVLNEAMAGRKDFQLSRYDDSLITDEFNHKHPVLITVIYYLYQVSVLMPWFFNKGLYNLSDEKMIAACKAAADKDNFTVPAALNMPQWSIFVTLPEISELSDEVAAVYPRALYDFGGFFAALQEETDGELYLNVMPVEHGGAILERFSINLGKGSMQEAMAKYNAETDLHFNTFKESDPDKINDEGIEQHYKSVQTIAPYVLKMVETICAADTKFTDRKGNPVVPENIKPQLHQGQELYGARLKEQIFKVV